MSKAITNSQGATLFILEYNSPNVTINVDENILSEKSHIA